MIFKKKIVKHIHEVEVRYYPLQHSKHVIGERVEREINPDNLDRSISESIKRTKQVIKDYARNNEFDYFVTLTFDPEKCNSHDIGDVYKYTRLFLQKLRRNNTELSYLLVPEFHADKQKIHLHGYIKGELELQKARNATKNGEILTYKGKTVYNLPQWCYGFSTAIKISKSVNDLLRCASYITKYVTKDMLIKFNQKRYWASRNLKRGIVVSDKLVGYDSFVDLRDNEFDKLLEANKPSSSDKVRVYESDYFYSVTFIDNE